MDKHSRPETCTNMLYIERLKGDLGQGLVVVIQAVSSLEVDSECAIPVLSEGPPILHSPHQAPHLNVALRASGLSGRATALVLCLCMYQIACSHQQVCPCVCITLPAGFVLCHTPPIERRVSCCLRIHHALAA